MEGSAVDGLRGRIGEGVAQRGGLQQQRKWSEWRALRSVGAAMPDSRRYKKLGFDLLKRMSVSCSPTVGEGARPLMRCHRSLEEALKLKKQGECAINRSFLN